jgi:DNA-binding transcriptional ArsR family regulator
MNMTSRLNVSDYQEASRFFHILSHPARLQILDILRNGEECVCHIQSVLGRRQAYVSQQLMVLRDAGLVTDRKDGLNVFYRLSDSAVNDVLKDILGPGDERVLCVETACPHCHTPQGRTKTEAH